MVSKILSYLSMGFSERAKNWVLNTTFHGLSNGMTHFQRKSVLHVVVWYIWSVFSWSLSYWFSVISTGFLEFLIRPDGLWRLLIILNHYSYYSYLYDDFTEFWVIPNGFRHSKSVFSLFSEKNWNLYNQEKKSEPLCVLQLYVYWH